MKLFRVEPGWLSVILMVRPRSFCRRKASGGLLSVRLEGALSTNSGLSEAPGRLLSGFTIAPAEGCFANGGTSFFLTSLVLVILLVEVDFEGVSVPEVADLLDAPTKRLLPITVAILWVLPGLTVAGALVVDGTVEGEDRSLVTIGPAMRVVLVELIVPVRPPELLEEGTWGRLEPTVGGFAVEKIDRLLTMIGPPIRRVPDTPVLPPMEAAGGPGAGEADGVDLMLLGGLLEMTEVWDREEVIPPGVVLRKESLGLLGGWLGVGLPGERLGIVLLGV